MAATDRIAWAAAAAAVAATATARIPVRRTQARRDIINREPQASERGEVSRCSAASRTAKTTTAVQAPDQDYRIGEDRQEGCDLEVRRIRKSAIRISAVLAACSLPFRQTYPNSEPPNSVTSVAHTPSSRSYVPTCRPPTQRPWYHPSLPPSLLQAWAQTKTKLAQRQICSDGLTTFAATKSL
jgi:hypothetical protein